jgi:hypothetical protein
MASDKRRVCCEREDVALYTQPKNGEEHGEPVTLMLCALCEKSIPDEAQVRREVFKGANGTTTV